MPCVHLWLPSCQVDIFQKDLLLIPIHLEVHWSLVSVDIPRKAITYFDSQRTLNRRCPKVAYQSQYYAHRTLDAAVSAAAMLRTVT